MCQPDITIYFAALRVQPSLSLSLSLSLLCCTGSVRLVLRVDPLVIFFLIFQPVLLFLPIILIYGINIGAPLVVSYVSYL